MNTIVVQNAIGELQKVLGKARDALTQIEAERHGYPEYLPHIGYEYPEDALASHLDELQEMLMIVLEAAEMCDTRTSLRAAWAAFKKGPKALKAVIDDDEHQYTYSPPLSYIERVLQSLRICVDKGLSGTEAAELERLEWILGGTAMLVHRRGDFPSGELKLQPIMHDYLSAAFPDFVKHPRISGGLKNFDPDCGVRGLGAAVEFKIVHTREAVATAISGVIEDIGGYRGSKDWTRFYSVFYQAHPFMTEAQVRKELQRAGGTGWTPVVVNGLTKPKLAKDVQIIKKTRTTKKKE
jgi:hypothetical protein